MQLVSVVEHYGDDSFLNKLVPEFVKRPLGEVALLREVIDRYRPLGRKHERFIERVKNRSERRGRVVFVDLTESVLESVGKFVTYALYPDSVYSVVIGLLKNGPKISVGYNPWSGKPLDTDISSICARYGGGGHPVVGGISFELHELDRARSVARTIAAELEG
jgi:nanoRNase/pAp phosphatase (c-di-AMP/oligoRNAs hydrolase)